jgi:hypothetical protein
MRKTFYKVQVMLLYPCEITLENLTTENSYELCQLFNL